MVGARLDAKLNLHVFNRLLRLPLDYFERHPAGETMYHIAQVYSRPRVPDRQAADDVPRPDHAVRAAAVPVLSQRDAGLDRAGLRGRDHADHPRLSQAAARHVQRVVEAETWKSAALGETIVGIKTVKALAFEPQRKALWDERVAEAGKWRLAFGRLANWPQTLVTPIERIMVLGTMLIGAYLAMNDQRATWSAACSPS